MRKSKKASSKSGQRGFLKNNLRVVVDTHLLANAAQASLEKHPHDASAAESLRLFEEILHVCSRVVLAVPQQREAWGNAPAQLRGAGHRLQIGASPVLAALEGKGKLLRPAASVIPKLSQQDQKPLRGKGHKRKITDDVHLYETAAQYDRIVITQDPAQHYSAGRMLRRLGVRVVNVQTALGPSRG